MKSGRHRIGSARNGGNGSRPAHASVDLDPKLFVSSEATDQAYRPYSDAPEGTYPGNGIPGNGHSTNGHSTDGTEWRGTPDVSAPVDDGTLRATGRIRGLERRTLLRVQQRFPKTTRLRLRVVLAILLVVVLAVVAVGGMVARSALTKTPGIVFTTAGPAQIANQPGGVGTLEDAPNESFTVSINLSGIQDAIFSISQVDVTNGSEVVAGTPLVQIDPTLLVQNAVQFQSQLASAQQALTTAQQTPPSATTNAQAEAQQIAALAEQVAYDRQLVAIAQGKTTTITSPTTGVVTGLTAQPGQVVSAGQPILEVIDPALVDVSASLLLTDIQTIAPGQAADVAPTGLPGVHLKGTVLTVSAISSSGGLDGTVIIQAQNTLAPVPIGTQVFVHVMATQSAAVTVPAVAVMNGDLEPTVFVLRNGHAYVQPVSIGASDATRIQITSGLVAGQKVVESNMQSLTNGERVRILGNG
jgi:membrane fusion protein, multidrug efflux system